MNVAATDADVHAHLMDKVYHWQRHIYDLTRKYYLFGRDRMIDGLDLSGGSRVLEIGCGTGRNLARVRRNRPDAELFGLDISAEMLKSARASLGTGALLAQGDAANFEAQALFGQTQFDRIIMPYCTSMMPVWRDAITHACKLLARGGSLHIIDFGNMANLPAPLRAGLLAWLARFHVTPRTDLAAHALTVGGAVGLAGSATDGMGGYYQMISLHRAV